MMSLLATGCAANTLNSAAGNKSEGVDGAFPENVVTFTGPGVTFRPNDAKYKVDQNQGWAGITRRADGQGRVVYSDSRVPTAKYIEVTATAERRSTESTAQWFKERVGASAMEKESTDQRGPTR